MQPEWVTSIGAFPLSFRSKICSSKLGRLRREGVLIQGTDYETYENAIANGYEIDGNRGGERGKSRYVYHVRNCIDRLEHRL